MAKHDIFSSEGNSELGECGQQIGDLISAKTYRLNPNRPMSNQWVNFLILVLHGVYKLCGKHVTSNLG